MEVNNHQGFAPINLDVVKQDVLKGDIISIDESQEEDGIHQVVDYVI